MKKILVFCVVAFISLNFALIANGHVSKEGRIKKDTYATSEDVLLRLIEPQLNKIITDKYGKEVTWQVDKVAKVGLILDHTKNPSDVWYDMKFAVRVFDDGSNGQECLLDMVEVRVDIPNIYTTDRYKEMKPTMTVKLIEYNQIR